MGLNNATKNLARKLLILHCIGLAGTIIQVQAAAGNGPVHIESNSAIYDDSKGISTYTGDVEIRQGGLTINSDELVIYLVNGNVDKLIATGAPVRFKHILSKGKEVITGKSLEAEYFPNQSLLLMKKEAVVWQGKDTYGSDIIKYDSKNAIVQAGKQSTDSKRVHVILQQNNEETVENGKTGSKASSEEVQ